MLRAQATSPLLGGRKTTRFLTRFSSATPFDEISGASGTLSGNANCDTTNMRLNLDGTDDYCTFTGSAVNTDMGAGWTVEAHANVVNGTADGLICGREGLSAGGWFLWYSLDPPGSAIKACQFYSYEWDGSVAPLLTATNVFSSNVERIIAVVRDGGVWRMYVDGVQAASASWSGAPANSTLPFRIGKDFLGAGRDMQGTVGRVKVSNVCLYPNGTTYTPPSRLSA